MLSHPLIVEAAELFFRPVCIFNNSKKAEDLAALKRFKEPSWNNPVTRIVTDEGQDVVPRNGSNWTVAALSKQLCDSLRENGTPIPAWLELLELESGAKLRAVETAIFGMT